MDHVHQGREDRAPADEAGSIGLHDSNLTDACIRNYRLQAGKLALKIRETRAFQTKNSESVGKIVC